MPVTAPTPDQVKQIASDMGLSLTESDVASFIALMKPNVDAYNVVDQLPDNLPQVRYPRTPGYRPPPEENEHNAWYYKTRVEGASEGKLAGRTVVLKDNVMLAGVPMMNGSSTLEGYTPDVDATIVSRILDAGGVILGKSHCEAFCLSGGSHTNATGPVHNPHKMGCSAGGSSSGSAVLVALGEADMAIGDLRRPHRADDGHGQGQRAPARGDRWPGRLRSPAVRAQGAPVHADARGRDPGSRSRRGVGEIAGVVTTATGPGRQGGGRRGRGGTGAAPRGEDRPRGRGAAARARRDRRVGSTWRLARLRNCQRMAV